MIFYLLSCPGGSFPEPPSQAPLVNQSFAGRPGSAANRVRNDQTQVTVRDMWPSGLRETVRLEGECVTIQEAAHRNGVTRHSVEGCGGLRERVDATGIDGRSCQL